MPQHGNINIISRSCGAAKLQLRSRTDGAELNLVLAFADMLVNQQKAGSNTALFLEPCIDSGYPDLVQVVYTIGFMDRWRDERMLLCDDDLRVLAYLSQARGASEKTISSMLGMNGGSVLNSLDLLCSCGMANRAANIWRASKKSAYFGIKSIVAYEAKLSSPSSVLRQAMINTRFASSSYALMPSPSPARKTIDSFSRNGIGLIAGPDFLEAVCPSKRALPNCYVTLKFNEWVARLISEGVIE